MTIDLTDNAPRVSYSVSQGATTTSFAVPFEFFDTTDLKVVVDGTTKTITTHYTVSGGNGSTGTVTMSVTGATGGSTVIIYREIPLSRTTDFPASGAFPIATLNTELDRTVALFDDRKDRIDRSIRLLDTDDAATMTLPTKDNRKGTVLGFNATTGAVEAGPTIANVNSLADITTNINTVAGIASNVTTVAGIQANVTTVAGISSNVSTVAGISSNVTTVAGKASLITSDFAADMALIDSTFVTKMGLVTSDFVTDMSLVTADFVSDVNVLATSDVVSDLNTLATSDIVADLAILATTDVVSDLNTLATSDIVSDLNQLATSDFVSDLNAVEGIKANVTTVAGVSSNVSTVAGISSNVTTVAGISSNVTSVAGVASNVTTVAGIASNVTTVAGDTTDIGTVASNISNVNTVANALVGTNTYTVTVVDSGGNKFALNSSTNPTLTLKRGVTYTFDQTNSTNDGHPLAFKDSGGSSYTTGLSYFLNGSSASASDYNNTTTFNAGRSSGDRKIEFAVASDAPSSLRYYCTVHGNGMGNTITVEDDNIAIVAGISSNVTTVAGISANVTTVAGANSNITTVASNISGVNSFADRYRVGSSDPSSSLDEGDLFYNTTSNDLKYYNGSSWQAISVITTGITNGDVPVFTSGAADDDFLRIAGTSIEGRSASEVLSDIGGQASLTFGISDTNAVKIDSSSVADDEYARFTANGLESRSTSEVLSDIGGAALSGATFTGEITADGGINEDHNNGALTNSNQTLTLDAHDGNNFSVTTAANITSFVVSNLPASGTAFFFTLKVTYGGSHSITWGSAVKWAGGTAPTLSTSGTDIFSFYTIDSGTTIYGFTSGQALA